MAFSSQVVTSLADAVNKLDTFLAAQGWSTHHVPGSGEFAAWKNPSGALWITFGLQWDTGTPRYAGVYQWHGQAYDTLGTTGTVPYDQDDDSGNGAASTVNATLAGQRRVDFGVTPEHLWIYEDTEYWHAILRTDTDIYEHFGSGIVLKKNDWVGGEYAYGHVQDIAFTTNTAIRGGTTILLDGLSADETPGLTNMEEYCATIHIDGMDEQALGPEIWAVCLGNQASGNLGTDRDGDDRIHMLGGYRGGPFVTAFGQFVGTIQRGLVPMYPIVQYYWNRTTGHIRGPMSQMPDVRGLNIKNYANEQDITSGSDTWTIFPSHKRRDIDASGAGFSNRQGIAYKKVT